MSNDASYADDEELVGQFIDWTSDAVREMREIVDALPDQEPADSGKADRLHDLAHNIKGMGSSFNFQLMTEIGLSFCVYLKGLNETLGKRVAESHVRAFEVVLQNRITGDGGEKGKALVGRLAEIVREEG
ncbi:MAG: hypothetical protein HWE25_11550 [Alphaproteobacteria bacterium]|nr:hypothetical protein [Alphaproteobacteria bacterium]